MITGIKLTAPTYYGGVAGDLWNSDGLLTNYVRAESKFGSIEKQVLIDTMQRSVLG